VKKKEILKQLKIGPLIKDGEGDKKRLTGKRRTTLLIKEKPSKLRPLLGLK
jgi:hypothetical protein